MATLKFARGTTVPKYSTSGFTDGCLYFNTSNHNIYLRNGTGSSGASVVDFKGTDTLPQYRRRTSGTTFGKFNYDMPLNAYIQSVPMSSNDSNAIDWYHLYGQGIVGSTTLLNATAEDGFDNVMQTYNPLLPPLDNARYIVCAVNLQEIGNAIDDSNHNLVYGDSTNAALLPSVPYMCIVTCYRTTESSYCTDANSNWSTVTTKPMFVGHCCPKDTSGSLLETNFMLYLCCNGTNDVYAQCYIQRNVGEGEITTCSFGAHSGLDANMNNTVVGIENCIYPLYIQY